MSMLKVLTAGDGPSDELHSRTPRSEHFTIIVSDTLRIVLIWTQSSPSKISRGYQCGMTSKIHHILIAVLD